MNIHAVMLPDNSFGPVGQMNAEAWSVNSFHVGALGGQMEPQYTFITARQHRYFAGFFFQKHDPITLSTHS